MQKIWRMMVTLYSQNYGKIHVKH